MRLKHRTAIITGSAQGIGKEFALRFAAEACKVAVADLQMEKAEKVAAEIRSHGGEAVAIEVDVTQEEQTLAMASTTERVFGSIDILINNAAIFPVRPWMEITADEWDRVMAVNARGYFFCARAVFPYMRQLGRGKIINIASNSILSGSPSFLHYTSSKGAVVAFTRSLARALGEFNINVNAIMPGLTSTEHVMESFDPNWRKWVVGKQCFKREEGPQDLPGAAVFLASDDSDFVTGQTIVVDGGASML